MLREVIYIAERPDGAITITVHAALTDGAWHLAAAQLPLDFHPAAGDAIADGGGVLHHLDAGTQDESGWHLPEVKGGAA